MTERTPDPEIGELINGEPWTVMDRVVWRAMHHVTQNRFERAQDIAAAVAAHLESEAAVRLADRAYWRHYSKEGGTTRQCMRAAISAAVARGDGGNGG